MNARLSEIAIGATAGLTGMAAMLAMRSFDQRYAPITVARMRNDLAEHAAASAVQLACGTLAGIALALVRRRASRSSPLIEGTLVGAALYGLGPLGVIPFLRVEPPVWKQRFPEIAGDVLRHLAYGVATAATHGALCRLRGES